MTKRVLGDGARCCGDCELCNPTTKKSRVAVEATDAADGKDDE